MATVYVAPVDEVAEGSAKTFTVMGKRVLIARVGERFYAIDDTCSHAQASMERGIIDADEVKIACPAHGAWFDLRTGRALSLPARKAVASYPVWIDGERIYVDIEG